MIRINYFSRKNERQTNWKIKNNWIYNHESHFSRFNYDYEFTLKSKSTYYLIFSPYISFPVQNESSSVQNGNSSVQNGNSSVQIGNSSVQNGNSSVQIGNSSDQNGNSSVQIGNSSVQIGNISVQNGKIIISINTKNIL